ncbi:DNA-binding transcriptional regulator, MerR family [Clostridium cavendishii DSM 21758]|uniref:DNA-binding transcriptional regulator, MerR family n=1 Tax=Clostridium cavendishii DSM 21758 TaxID=1121302 RepID=A0A1M6GQW1_9CLOT|nr:MerR family transcriptional regulator [Clostridium cavendishii]SHJ12288.1 DNA-binding transcriptional regulator, MerR family [Clostridium cavendishii DSM 21758]
MNNKILISDFVKLTGSTLKTVLYYHKIGLLKEPKRSTSGYRLYGAEELERMRVIKHLKHLGLDLKQIKEILGDTQNSRSIVEVLKSLQSELLIEKRNIEEQLSKIETLLNQEVEELKETSFASESFKVITETLNTNQVKEYRESSPELYNQQRNVFGVMDDFKWEKDYKENFKKIAEHFKEHPEQYKIALEFGKRLSKLKEMSEDDEEVEALAREGAEFIKKEPLLKEMLYGKSGFGETNENLFNEMSNRFLSPAQIKHKKLIQKYLNYEPENNK